MPAELKRKPRPTPHSYNLNRQPKQPKVAEKPRTSTQAPTEASRQNLTLGDWLTVFAYIDSHSQLPQTDVVKHFSTLKSGALVFTQSTLSRKLKERSNLETHVNDNPSALSSKRRKGGDKAIVAEVIRETAERDSEVIQVDEEEDDDDEDESSAATEPEISRAEAIHLCRKLREACLQHADANSDVPLALLTQLRRFQAYLHREELLHAKQTTLDPFFDHHNHARTPHATT